MMSENSTIFHKSIVVVAHPDDEILWLSSILNEVDHIIFCFLEYPPDTSLGKGRRGAISEYPFANISCLNITEAESFNGANWSQPIENEYGLRITSNKAAAQRYADNYNVLHKMLTESLKGFHNVFTHNPWGEYGHEDHVQVYRAIKDLQKKYGFNLWFTNYCGNRSYKLMLKYISGFNNNYYTFHANIDLATKIANLYKQYKCWTWYGNYQWFKEECLINDAELTNDKEEFGHIFPINFIKTNIPEKSGILKQLFNRARLKR